MIMCDCVRKKSKRTNYNSFLLQYQLVISVASYVELILLSRMED